MLIGPIGFPQLIFLLLFLALPILPKVLTLRREDFSLTNKILLVVLSCLILLAGLFALFDGPYIDIGNYLF